MLMVSIDAAGVERQLRAGELACPSCVAMLRPWGNVPRRQRRPDGSIERGVRCSRCTGCRTTHVLLPVSALRRRVDAAETIVLALFAHVRGMGQRKVAAGIHRHESTVRGWLRRARRLAAAIRDLFARLGHERFGCALRLSPLESTLADALNVIGMVGQAAVQQLGPAPLWHFVAGASEGGLLCNTSRPFPQAPAQPQAAASAVTTPITTAQTEGYTARERPPP